MRQIIHLTKRSEFLRVQNRGSKAVSRAFVLQGYQRPNNETYISRWRIGYTASKRVGNAVCRNRAKRRLRALIQQHMPPVARPDIDYVLIARVPATDKSYRLEPKALQMAVAELHGKLDRRTKTTQNSRHLPKSSQKKTELRSAADSRAKADKSTISISGKVEQNVAQ